MLGFTNERNANIAFAVAAALGLAIAASGVLAPIACSARWVPPCPLRSLLGLYCPACGGMRAASCLVRGDPLAAFSMNPLFVLTLFALPFLPLCPRRVRQYAPWWVFLGGLVLFGIARNIPLLPFSLFAPS